MFSAVLNKLIETFLMCMLAFLCLIECSDLNRWQYLTVEDIMQWVNFHRLVFIFSRTKHDVVVSRIPYSTVV